MEVNYIGTEDAVNNAIDREYYMNAINFTMVKLFSDPEKIKKSIFSDVKSCVKSYVKDDINDLEKSQLIEDVCNHIVEYININLTNFDERFWIYCIESFGIDFAYEISYGTSYYLNARSHGYMGGRKLNKYKTIFIDSFDKVIQEKIEGYTQQKSGEVLVNNELKEVDISLN